MKTHIRELAREQRALILAHNYQPPEIQDIADMVGDSLELSLKASETDAAIIVFCGVHFMAETAAILCPEKTVLLPRTDAGCPMADMVTPEALFARKQALGNIPVVTYVNSSAAVKAVSDVCCTSANVVRIVTSLDANEILMTPDKNLAAYAARHTDKKIHLWEGYCPFHNTLRASDVRSARNAHPDALFLAHPECPPDILDMADAVCSTSGMIQYAGTSSHTEFILGTEVGLLYPIARAHPDKKFYAASPRMLCPDMKKITLDDVRICLETGAGRVQVPEDIRIRALGAVHNMIQIK